MEEEKKKNKTGSWSIIDKVKTSKTELRKVTNTVGTFLKEDSNGVQKTRVPATKTVPEKVTNTVGTFLNKDSDGFLKI